MKKEVALGCKIVFLQIFSQDSKIAKNKTLKNSNFDNFPFYYYKLLF